MIGGEFLSTRRADRRYWRVEAVRHAGAIVANKRYLRELAKAARDEGREALSTAELHDIAEDDRQADSLFFLSPVPEELRTSLRSLIRASNTLRHDMQCTDHEWLKRLNDQKQAIYDFEALMRASLGGSSERATVRADGTTTSPIGDRQVAEPSG